MRLVIVGGGAAGMSAATQARRTDPQLEIIVLERSDQVSTGLCGLPYFVAGTIADVNALVAHPPDYFRQERRIDVRTGHWVQAVHAGQRRLTGVGPVGSFELTYDRLIVATGARPRQLRVPGADLPHVFSLRTLADGVRLKAYLTGRTVRRAAVIGGGSIGLELAEALTGRQLAVTVIEQGPHLAPAFDPWIAALVADELKRHNVTPLTAHTVLGIDPDAVQTRESGAIPADLVVVAVGNEPNLDLLSGARAEIGRSGALAVSRSLQTSLPAIWAAGDCAEGRSAVTGRPVHVPLGTVANLLGRVAGQAAAGRRAEVQPLAGTYLLQLFDLAIARTGLSETEARANGFTPVTAAVTGPTRLPGLAATVEGGTFQVHLVADKRTGRLLGGALAGHRAGARRIDLIAGLLARGATVAEVAGLDLGYTPPLGVARDPLVLAAQRLSEGLS